MENLERFLEESRLLARGAMVAGVGLLATTLCFNGNRTRMIEKETSRGRIAGRPSVYVENEFMRDGGIDNNGNYLTIWGLNKTYQYIDRHGEENIDDALAGWQTIESIVEIGEDGSVRIERDTASGETLELFERADSVYNHARRKFGGYNTPVQVDKT